MDELDYDQVIAAYEVAIEINPKKESYMRLADVCIEMNSYEQAMEVLKAGENVIGTQELSSIYQEKFLTFHTLMDDDKTNSEEDTNSNEYNKYGVIIFEKRWNYIQEDALSEGEKHFYLN